jgi:hypothetical protein
MATSRLALEALQRLDLKNVVLLTPYKSNRNIIDCLNAYDIGVVRCGDGPRTREFRQGLTAAMDRACEDA